MPTVEELLFRAKIAEQAKYWDELLTIMKQIMQCINCDDDMTREIKDLIAIGFKEAVAKRRTPLRILKKIVEIEEAQRPYVSTLAKELSSPIENEIYELCENIQKFVDPLVDSTSNISSKVFYLKLKGDSYRYLTEIESHREKAIELAEAAYQAALEFPFEEIDSLMLTVTLNRSILYYDIVGDKYFAIKCLEQILKSYEMTHQSDTTITQPAIVKLIKTNLEIWKKEVTVEPSK